MINKGIKRYEIFCVIYGTANPNHEILCKYYSGTW